MKERKEERKKVRKKERKKERKKGRKKERKKESMKCKEICVIDDPSLKPKCKGKCSCTTCLILFVVSGDPPNFWVIKLGTISIFILG